MSSPKKTLEEYLLEEVERTGYPLEIEISSILDQIPHLVAFNNQYYFDEDGQRGRTIDMYCIYTKHYFAETPSIEPFGLRTDIAIECKKSNTHAWIFFTRPEAWRSPYFSGQTLDSLNVHTDGEINIIDKILPLSRDLETTKFLHYDRFQKTAIAHHEAKIKKLGKHQAKQMKGKNPNGFGEINEATNQVVKFVSFELGKLVQMYREVKYSRIVIYFPIIVFDGRMYEYTTEKGFPELIPTNHILMETSYRPGYSDSPLTFGIDVIRKEFFKLLMSIIEEDISLLREGILSQHGNLVKYLEESSQKK